MPFLSFLIALIFPFVMNIRETFAEYKLDPPTQNLPNLKLSPDNTIANIISFGIKIAAILAIIAITWWAIQMILAAWEEEKVKKWRMTVIYSLVWVMAAGLAYGIVKIITSLQFLK